MSLPYQPHSEYQSPHAAPPPPVKSRPSWAWFAVGGVLLVVAGVIFGIAIYHFVRTVSHTDAVFPATGEHAVNLPAGTERGFFVPEGRPIPRCHVTDGSGAALHFRSPDERFTYGQWVAVRVFDTGDGTLVFSCGSGAGGQIRIAPIPSQGDFARLGFLGILLPLGLGGVGFVVLLVTTILWISRRPRQPGAAYGVPPGPAYGPGYPPGYPATYPPSYPPSYPPTDSPMGTPPADPGGPPSGSPPEQG